MAEHKGTQNMKPAAEAQFSAVAFMFLSLSVQT